MTHPHLILPVGTQVVTLIDAKRLNGDICPKGAIGVVEEAPLDSTHSYTVRLPDGSALRARRNQVRIHRSALDDELAQAAEPFDLTSMQPQIIFRCVVGSQAYGLSNERSDVDKRGIYLPTARQHWSLFGIPEQLESDETQECYWELQKFLRMALKANPNIMECLYTPLVEYCHPIARELLEMRQMFLTRKIYQTYNGYVLSQFKRLEQDLRTRGALNWKHAMHLVRLLLGGVEALRTGELHIHAGNNRDSLLAIRRGEWTWDQVNCWRLELHRDFEAAQHVTKLPELPDFHKANDFLYRARMWAVTQE